MDEHCKYHKISTNPHTKKIKSKKMWCWLLIFQHKRFIQECREKDPEILFLGDSILETLQFTEFFNQSFAPLHVLNFSIYSDQTNVSAFAVIFRGIFHWFSWVSSFPARFVSSEKWRAWKYQTKSECFDWFVLDPFLIPFSSRRLLSCTWELTTCTPLKRSPKEY
jgi:hypothetical protein